MRSPFSVTSIARRAGTQRPSLFTRARAANSKRHSARTIARWARASTGWHCCIGPRAVTQRPSHFTKARGPDNPAIGTVLNNLAVLYVRQGRYAEAEPLYGRARAIAEKALGPDHP